MILVAFKLLLGDKAAAVQRILSFDEAAYLPMFLRL
jgi:hypothetical protein